MLGIQKKLIGYNFSKRSSKAQYIVIHDVGEKGSTAQNNKDYFAGGDRQASADFFIDSNNIIQIIDYTKNYSWAIGDGHGEFGKTNANSLSIEMCLENNGQPSEKTIQNTLDLAKYLMKELNIGIGNVVRHYDCSHKNCPGSFSANNWAKWTNFKTRLASTSSVAIPTDTFRVRLSWNNEKSQIGCTSDLYEAKDIANAHGGYSVYDSKGKNLYTLAGSKPPETYRIRKSWAEESTQIGDVYTDLYQAKDYANLHVGYSVYNSAGKNLYTLAVANPVVSTDTTYRVVTGSFSDKANADKRVEDLKKVGVDSFIITK
ncbi:MAG TPA: N-acetylmuramoyl-L-alanine amidase [Clostridium sp.]